MGTYNYPARELADEIVEFLNNLEGDFTSIELAKALRLVAVEHGVQPTHESGRKLPAKKSNRKGSAPAKSG